MEACKSCAVAITNGDTTHIEDVDTITALENLGMATAELSEEGETFFRCDVCDNNTVSDIYTVEAV